MTWADVTNPVEIELMDPCDAVKIPVCSVNEEIELVVILAVLIVVVDSPDTVARPPTYDPDWLVIEERLLPIKELTDAFAV